MLGERRIGVEDEDAREAIKAARAFKENLKQRLNKKFVVIENMENNADAVIIKSYISYRPPIFRRLSRNAYFRGDVAVVLEIEHNGKKICRIMAGGDYTDKSTWWPMPLEKKLILTLDYIVPKLEEALGG